MVETPKFYSAVWKLKQRLVNTEYTGVDPTDPDLQCCIDIPKFASGMHRLCQVNGWSVQLSPASIWSFGDHCQLVLARATPRLL